MAQRRHGNVWALNIRKFSNSWKYCGSIRPESGTVESLRPLLLLGTAHFRNFRGLFVQQDFSPIGRRLQSCMFRERTVGSHGLGRLARCSIPFVGFPGGASAVSQVYPLRNRPGGKKVPRSQALRSGGDSGCLLEACQMQ